jgi:hypothetical protein
LKQAPQGSGGAECLFCTHQLMDAVRCAAAHIGGVARFDL